MLLGFFLLARIGGRNLAAGWLAASSLFFYGWWWNPIYVGLLLASIICNYTFGLWIAQAGIRRVVRKKRLLVTAITANLTLLAYCQFAA